MDMYGCVIVELAAELDQIFGGAAEEAEIMSPDADGVGDGSSGGAGRDRMRRAVVRS